MKEYQCILITLPKSLEHIPVEIIRDGSNKGIVMGIIGKDEIEPKSFHAKEYAFI